MSLESTAFSNLKVGSIVQAPWCVDAQKEAYKILSELEVPNFKVEEWKYSSLRGVQKTTWKKCNSAGSNELASGQKIVISQGVVDVKASELPKGISVLGLGELNAEQRGFVSSRLLALKTRSEYFSLLNAATSEDISVIVVSKEFDANQPLEIAHKRDANSDEIINGRIIIFVEQDAEISLVEKTFSDSCEGFENLVYDIKLSQNSRLNRYDLKGKAEGYSFSKVFVDCDKSSSYSELRLLFGAKLQRSDTVVNLLEEDSEANLRALYIGKESAHIDYQSEIHHLCPNARSNQHVKGVLTGEARFIFNGKIFVAKGATGTDSSQLNGNLLLGDKVEVDTKPTLLIDNDDVKCSHGATVSRINDEQLFYFQTRGITKDVAEAMLSLAFVEEVVYSVDNKELRKKILSSVEQYWKQG